MSSTASNYSIGKLCAGIAMGTVALSCTVLISIPVLMRVKPVALWFMLVTLTYGVMMFASSYVEEEHQYWFWVASAWLCWLALKQ